MPGGKRKVGDLVWAVVRGYPNWPGQVMDPKTAPARVYDSKKAGDTILVSFFADSSYGWFPDVNLHDFEAKYDDFKHQKANKSAKVLFRLWRTSLEGSLSARGKKILRSLVSSAELWPGCGRSKGGA